MSTSTTVNARPITFAEIEALATGEAPQEFTAYLQETSAIHGETLTPATITVRQDTALARRGEAVPHYKQYAAVPDDRPSALKEFRADVEHPVGYKVSVGWVNMFGSQSGLTLFTSPEAEESARVLNGWAESEAGRLRLYVTDAKAPKRPLTPVFGSQLSVGVVVEGVTPEELRERAERALQAEFGDALRPVRKVLTRLVKDARVNVYAMDDRELVATNVLDAETSYVTNGNCHTEEVTPEQITG
jgi:hypothetical protein